MKATSPAESCGEHCCKASYCLESWARSLHSPCSWWQQSGRQRQLSVNLDFCCQGVRRGPVRGVCWTVGQGMRTAANSLCSCSATAPPVPAGGSSLGCSSQPMRLPSNYSALHSVVRSSQPCHHILSMTHAYSASCPPKIAKNDKMHAEESAIVADKMLGPSLQLPGSLLGSLYSLSQPLFSKGSSQEAAAAELQEAVESSDRGPNSMHAQFVAEMERLGGGSLLLRQGPAPCRLNERSDNRQDTCGGWCAWPPSVVKSLTCRNDGGG